MKYEFNLIDASRFRILKKYRYVLYYLLIFLIFLINKPKKKFQLPNRPNSSAEMLGINVNLLFISILIFGLIAISLHIYSKKYEVLGKLIINDTQIIFEELENNQILLFEEIKNLIIERGATWHYEHKDGNYLNKSDNWIVISTNNQEVKREFSIISLNNNNDFEQMITFLRTKPIPLLYKSI